jgi:hypothetical protein
MGFDAANAVTPLDYDLSAYKGEDGKPLSKGTIPEPSRAKLDAFWEGRRQVLADAGIDLAELEGFDPLDPDSRAELTKKFASIPDEKRKAMAPAQLKHVAAVCSNTPSEQEIKALPGRVQDAFIGWLMGLLSNPTPSSDTSD